MTGFGFGNTCRQEPSMSPGQEPRGFGLETPIWWSPQSGQGWLGCRAVPGGMEPTERAGGQGCARDPGRGRVESRRPGGGGHFITGKQRENGTARPLQRVRAWAFEGLHHPWSPALTLGFVSSCLHLPLSCALSGPTQHALAPEFSPICRQRVHSDTGWAHPFVGLVTCCECAHPHMCAGSEKGAACRSPRRTQE